MITKTADEARTGWGELIEAVTASVGREDVAITRTRGRPADRVQAAEIIAVLVSTDWYDAIPEKQLPAEAQTSSMKSSEVRTGLREVLEAANRGVHTTVTLYGKPCAVLVPHAWYQQQVSQQ